MMSNYTAMTRHPETGEIKPAFWIDNFYGQHSYGVRFCDNDKVTFPAHRCEQMVMVPVFKDLRQIGELIRTQDNRATDAPLFIVEELVRIVGIMEDYTDNFVWMYEGSEADESEKALLDQLEIENKEVPEGWEKVGYVDQWKFVTACFTEKGCGDYLTKNGHNLGQTRIYAAGSYRNEEFRAVREFLKSL
jgi:hypothetical protein